MKSFPEKFEERLWIIGFVLCILCLIILVMLCGCASQRIGGDQLRDLGRDAEIVYYRGPAADGTGARYIVMGQNESKSFEKGAGVVKSGIFAGAVKSVSSDVKGILSDRNATGAATEQLRINTGAASADLQTTTAAGLEAQRIGLEPDLSP